jgi:hypothetical protein
MDPSNKNFSNLTNQDSPSFPEDSSKGPLPNNFPIVFAYLSFPKISTHNIFITSTPLVAQATAHHMVLLHLSMVFNNRQVGYKV